MSCVQATKGFSALRELHRDAHSDQQELPLFCSWPLSAVTLFSVAGTAGLCAQQSSGTTNSLPAVDLRSVLAAPIDLTAPSDLNYSSSVGSAEMASAEAFTLSNDSGQPPPRRKYSKPNYSDSHTNSDGSAKWSFFRGGGLLCRSAARTTTRRRVGKYRRVADATSIRRSA